MLNAGLKTVATKASRVDLKKLRKQAAEAAEKAQSQVQATTHKPQSGKTRLAGIAKASTLDVQPLSPQDQALFRQTMRYVQRIKDTRRAILPPKPVAPPTILLGRKAAAQGVISQGKPAVSDLFAPAPVLPDIEGYLKRGLGPDVLKNLKRDKWPIEASLDLHGSTLEQARDRLDQFLQSCLTHGVKCVRIVHGKGYGSKEGTPVLKDAVRSWLTQFEAVLAYTECSEQNGGSGALQALLIK